MSFDVKNALLKKFLSQVVRFRHRCLIQQRDQFSQSDGCRTNHAASDSDAAL